MKWIILVALIGMVPPLTMLLRAQPRYLVHACYLMGLLVFFLDPYLNISPISWFWSGAVKGFELSIIDAIAVAIIFSTRTVKLPWTMKMGFAIYVTGIVISSFYAPQITPVGFYVWQLMRAVIVCMAVARATTVETNAAIALAAGLGTGIIVEALLATKQYIGGDSQPGGTLGHRNILGLTSHFAVMPALALLLAARRSLLAAAVVIAGAVIGLTGGGRATLGLYPAGIILTTALSMRHKITGRKAALAGAAGFFLLLAAPVMMWSIDRRSAEARASSDKERRALIEAAQMIIRDYPLGVGANQYVMVANLGGYSSRAGVAWNYGSRSAPVHNSYYLVFAELGPVGLVGLLAVLASVILTGLRATRKLAAEERSELLLGFVGALIIVSIHMAFEWLFATSYIHYLLAMNMGAVVGLAAVLRARSPARTKRGTAASHPALGPKTA